MVFCPRQSFVGICVNSNIKALQKPDQISKKGFHIYRYLNNSSHCEVETHFSSNQFYSFSMQTLANASTNSPHVVLYNEIEKKLQIQ